MYKKKAAITLFITLAVVVAMLSLVGIVFTYLADARSRAVDKAALIQANVLFADARDALDTFVGKNPSVGRLKNIYDVPVMLKEKKGRFNMLIACLPAHAAIPITWFKEGAENQARYNLASLVLEDIVLKHEIKDAALLSDLISKAVSQEYTTEFGKLGRVKRDLNYFSYNSFKKVLNDYILQTDDMSVYKVNWNLFYSFGEDFKELDGDFLSAKLISIIFGIDEQIVKEDFKSGELKNFLIENGGDIELYNSTLFAKKPVVAMKCSANYKYGDRSYSFSFKYIDKKVSDFEFSW
ncbi:MAG: hypothetical protein GXO02_03840 [Epsilonproteobacteria bacterium]|nr:hypothetical protein [Campylobacterota bacterium]